LGLGEGVQAKAALFKAKVVFLMVTGEGECTFFEPIYVLSGILVAAAALGREEGRD